MSPLKQEDKDADSDSTSNVPSAPAIPSSFITNVHANDILLGRGTPMVSFKGNVAFRELIAQRQEEYTNAKPRQNKDRVAREILDEIARRKGRFLRQVESTEEIEKLGVPDGVTAWTEADEAVALEKIKQAFRRRDQVRSQHRNRGPPSAADQPSVQTDASDARIESGHHQQANDPTTSATSASASAPIVNANVALATHLGLGQSALSRAIVQPATSDTLTLLRAHQQLQEQQQQDQAFQQRQQQQQLLAGMVLDRQQMVAYQQLQLLRLTQMSQQQQLLLSTAASPQAQLLNPYVAWPSSFSVSQPQLALDRSQIALAQPQIALTQAQIAFAQPQIPMAQPPLSLVQPPLLLLGETPLLQGFGTLALPQQPPTPALALPSFPPAAPLQPILSVAAAAQQASVPSDIAARANDRPSSSNSSTSGDSTDEEDDRKQPAVRENERHRLASADSSQASSSASEKRQTKRHRRSKTEMR